MRSRAATSARRISSIGHYLQDWLLKETDYSWRLEPDKGGASSALGDIGSHWCDLAQHISGLRITHVLGDITTVLQKRKKPKGSREAFAAAGGNDEVETVDVKVEDLASVLLRFDNGAKGSFSVGQVCAGHKNDLVLEICGSKSSMRWRQEHQNELWRGHRDRANEILQKDPSLLDPEASALRASAGRAPGSVGGRLLQSDARHLRVHRRRQSRRAIRIHRRLPRSKTAIAPTASSKPFSPVPRAASGPKWSTERPPPRRVSPADRTAATRRDLNTEPCRFSHFRHSS